MAGTGVMIDVRGPVLRCRGGELAFGFEPWFVVTAGYSAEWDHIGIHLYFRRQKWRNVYGFIRSTLVVQVGDFDGVSHRFRWAPWFRLSRHSGARRV